MNISGPNPAPAATEPQVALKRVAAPAEPAVPRDKAPQKPLNVSNTSVLVEMERNNTLVYKFIDETTGRVFQQFPPEQMSQHEPAALPDIPGKAAGPKQA